MAQSVDRRRLPVVLDHDGGVDDLAALAILGVAKALGDAATDRPVPELIGVVAIDADCFVEPAVDVSLKLAALCQLCAPSGRVIDVGASTLTCGGPEPFPDDWRLDCIEMTNMPCLNSAPVLDALRDERGLVRRRTDVTGQELLAELVMASPEPVAICVTGPLSDVAYCLQTHGEAFAKNVDRVVIMGGAVDTQGNVFTEGRDGSAEWNIYWDPAAAAVVASTPLLRPEQRVFFLLDATNSVPVTREFVSRFGAVISAKSGQQTQLAHFFGTTWALCTAFERLFGDAKGYYAWDALTAAYVVDPAVCHGLDTVLLEIDTAHDSPGCGRTRRVETLSDPKLGGKCAVARDTDAARFYSLVVALAGVSP